MTDPFSARSLLRGEQPATRVEFYIDSADLSLIERLMATHRNVFSGITTNTTSLASQGSTVEEFLTELHGRSIMIPTSVMMLEEGTEDAMVRRGAELHERFPSLVLKLPMSARSLSLVPESPAPVNMTLLFNLVQGVFAAQAGASYGSFFVGRFRDNHPHLANEIFRDMRDLRIFLDRNSQLRMRIIAASIRDYEDVRQSIVSGAHIITLSERLLADPDERLFIDPLTRAGMADFLQSMPKIQS